MPNDERSSPASTRGDELVSRARSSPAPPEESRGLLFRPTLVVPTFSCPVPVRQALRLVYVEPPQTNFGVPPPAYQSFPWNLRSLAPASCVLVTSTRPTPPDVEKTLFRRCTRWTSLVSRLALETRAPQMGPVAAGATTTVLWYSSASRTSPQTWSAPPSPLRASLMLT